jgi:hypothetical protein
MSTFGFVFSEARTQEIKRQRKPRTPVTVRAARALGQAVGRVQQRVSRGAFLQVGALSSATYGTFELFGSYGWYAVCASLFVLEFLSGGDK